ncbi:hypothetical protein [Streptomyces sp. NPDC047043]|uniref:hypothetical protein n=1 Tax=Streptomyces sp. NPDC047043 TaxID=3154497 RepID=UPI0033CE3E99
MPKAKPQARRGRLTARAISVAMIVFLAVIGGSAISQAAETSAPPGAAHDTVIAQEKSAEDWVHEAEDFISRLVHDFAETVKPSVSVHFAVTIGIALAGSHLALKFVFRSRRTSRNSTRNSIRNDYRDYRR